MLQGALGKLMQTKSLDEISVQDIADVATVNRVTFYDHYTDKFALLQAMVAGGFHQMLAERKIHFDKSCPSGVSAVILAVCDYLVQSHSSDSACERHSPFEPLIEAAVITSIRRVLGNAGTGRTPLQREIAITMASSAIYGAAKEWFNARDRPAAQSIVPDVVKLVVPMLATVSNA